MAKRGRKPKHQNGQDQDIEARDDVPAQGHNQPPELTDDEKRALFFQHKRHYEAALSTKRAADAALKNTCKKAKAECGKDAVAEIKDAIAFEGDDGRAKFDSEMERKHRVARWLGMPVGAQASFFDGADRTPSVDLAFDDGKVAGMRGDTCSPPHDPSVPQHGKWIEGWHDGQAILASAFRKREAVPAEEDDGLPPTTDLPRADLSDPPFQVPAAPH